MRIVSENVTSAANQQGSPLSVSNGYDPSETTRRAPSVSEVQHYFWGVKHDGTKAKLHNSIRIAQKEREWLTFLQKLLKHIGHNSWIYKEGKERSVYILETYAEFIRQDRNPTDIISKSDQIAYIRGFFDAEGGIPQKGQARFYIQLVQKDYKKLQIIKDWLTALEIGVGKIHNPSARVDPHYWRMFVRTHSHQRFMSIIGSWHPRKQAIFESRMVI
ncbi:MAG: LAGLIDADG homing endonuclease [Parcubacteria group bacterium GW2011_GWA2_47_8]|nr:MAG: LAGLIDADG homing endonuclease [Parcubacteria group bacterium GW2011_GWA2_47_8]OHB18262.1 MAG: hypothetical protein A2666_00650 [Parcubacteria group bacterium RIFCSPHIGHO2_01_FULL_47_10b]